MQAATHSQSYNRYSYTFNNPFNATDPSGYIAWEPILKAAAWIAGSYAAGDYGRRNNLPWLGQAASIAGCIYGYCASAAFGSTYGATQNLGVAIAAGVSAGALSGMNPAARFLMSGVSGGTASVMMGGEYGHGFVSAGLGTLAGSVGGGGLNIGGLIASAIVGGTVSEMTGGKFKNGAASAAFAYAMTWAASKIGAGGTTYEVEGDPNAIDAIPDDPEKTYQEGLALAKDNPHADGADRAQYVDKIKIGKCVSVDKCTQTRTFTSNAEAKEFMLNNKGWAQILGEQSGSNIWIYRGATASITHYFSDTVSDLRRSSAIGCGCLNLSGAENVLKTLAHEGGHFSGLGHTNDLYIRERNAIEYKRGLGL